MQAPCLAILLCIAAAVSGESFRAQLGIMVRLHGTGGARLGAVREEAAGAAIMAIDHIRNRNTSLVPAASALHPRFSIDFHLADTHSDPSVGVRHAVDFSERGTHLIVGAARSAVSGPVALVAGLSDTPVLSYSSTASVLGTSTYPMFSRVIPNDALPAYSLIKVCQELGWLSIALLFIDDSYGQGYAQSVQNYAAEHGVNILVAPSFATGDVSSITKAVKGVKDSGARIIFCVTFAQDVETLAVVATQHGLVGRGFVWLTGDSINDPVALVEGAESAATMAEFLCGFLSIQTKPLYGRKGERFDAVWQYEKKRIDLTALSEAAGYGVGSLDGDCSDMCGYTYDAVWAAALAINAATDFETMELDKPILLTKLRELDFQASTGQIRFDPETGDRSPGGISVIYQNWVPTDDGRTIRPVDLFQWDAEGGLVNLGQTPVWGGNVATHEAPPDGTCEGGSVYSTELLRCVLCEPGTHEHHGRCVACEVGKVAPSAGMSACVQCESGYADSAGMRACTACPPNSARDSTGSGVSRAECLCTAGYFSEVAGGECAICAPGAVCRGGGALPEPRYGFWGQKECRQFGGEMECGERWLNFYECSVPGTCPGGEGFKCKNGHTGPQCKRAQDGWFQVGGTNHLECGEYGKVVSLVLIMLVVLMWYGLNKIVSSHYDALDIALLFVQVVGMISSYGFKWHSSMEYLNLALSVANFDVDFVTPLCLVEWSQANSFFLQLLLPLIFAALKALKMLIRHLVRSMRGVTDAGWSHALTQCAKRRFLSASIVLYHTLCLRCFEVFRCEQYPDGEEYMMFAPQTQCWTPTHKAMMGVSVLYIIVVIVGTPLTLYLVIRWYKERHLLHCPVAVKQWGFVHIRYEAEYKYWEVMLVLRRGLIAFLYVFFDSPMLKGAVTMVALTGLLSAHVFTKPYVDSQIDVLDFCSILGSMLYCLAGILSYPSITARTQGVICTEGADTNPPECDAELSTKLTISTITFAVVALTLAVSVYLASVNIREKRLSRRAAKLVQDHVMTRSESLGEVGASVNKVSLVEMLDGRLLLPWASSLLQRRRSLPRLPSLRNLNESFRARSASSRNVCRQSSEPSCIELPALPPSAVAYLQLEKRLRAVEVDMTQFSTEPVANIVRKLCEIDGLCDWLSCASVDGKRGLRAFVREFEEFLQAADSQRGHFALSAVVREEHRPLMSYWLLQSEGEDVTQFWRLLDSILATDTASRHGVLSSMSSSNLLELEHRAAQTQAKAPPPHPWMTRRQEEMAELWRHQPDHRASLRLGRHRRASLPLVESLDVSQISLSPLTPPATPESEAKLSRTLKPEATSATLIFAHPSDPAVGDLPLDIGSFNRVKRRDLSSHRSAASTSRLAGSDSEDGTGAGSTHMARSSQPSSSATAHDSLAVLRSSHLAGDESGRERALWGGEQGAVDILLAGGEFASETLDPLVV